MEEAEEEVEYFNISHEAYLALKQLKGKGMLNAKKAMIKVGHKNCILGIDKKIVREIKIFYDLNIDTTCIASSLELPLPIVNVILKEKYKSEKIDEK